MLQEELVRDAKPISAPLPRPLLRGWFHAAAALGAVLVMLALCWQSRSDFSRLLSMAVYGLSMIELYTVSALYHLVTWSAARRKRLRALDHANIFVLIAGTYTPLCFNILSGGLRLAMLVEVWVLAISGVWLAVFRPQTPRAIATALYIGIGWIGVLALPAFLSLLPWMATALLVAGGLLYTVGGVIYARRWPNPFPRVFGYHEIFHLFVIAAGALFTLVIWVWALPFPRR